MGIFECHVSFHWCTSLSLDEKNVRCWLKYLATQSTKKIRLQQIQSWAPTIVNGIITPIGVITTGYSMCCSGAEKAPFVTGGGPAHLVAATIFSTTTSPAVAGGFDSESSHFAVPNQNPNSMAGPESVWRVEVVEAPQNRRHNWF